MFKAIPCGCGYRACPDWRVTDNAQLQGASFTKEQAELVAAALNATEFEAEYVIYCDDDLVASVIAPHDHNPFGEALHYAAQYQSEGEVRIERVIRIGISA